MYCTTCLLSIRSSIDIIALSYCILRSPVRPIKNFVSVVFLGGSKTRTAVQASCFVCMCKHACVFKLRIHPQVCHAAFALRVRLYYCCYCRNPGPKKSGQRTPNVFTTAVTVVVEQEQPRKPRNFRLVSLPGTFADKQQQTAFSFFAT